MNTQSICRPRGIHSRIAQTLASLLLLAGLASKGSASVTLTPPVPVADGGAVMGLAAGPGHMQAGIENVPQTRHVMSAKLLGPTGATIATIDTGRTGSNPRVACSGTNYLMAWSDDDLGMEGGTSVVAGQFITQAGAKSGTPFMIGDGARIDGNRPVAFGGGKYLVTYTHLIDPDLGDYSTNRCIYGRLVEPNGNMGAEFRISTAYGKDAETAFDGSRFLVVWCEDQYDQEIRARFVSTDGTLGTEFSVNASPAPSDNPKSLAFNGSNYLVVWNDETGGMGSETWDIHGQLVSPTGSLVGGTIDVNTGIGVQMPTGITASGSNFIVSFANALDPEDIDFHAQAIGPTGTLLGGEEIIADDSGNQVGVVGYANGTYFAAVNDGVVFGEDGLEQVTGSSVMFATTFPPATTPTPVTIATGSAAMDWASDGTNYLVTLDTPPPSRAPSICAQLLAADGSKIGGTIETGRTGIAAMVAFDGTNYLLTWEDDLRGSKYDYSYLQVYGMRISAAGVAIDDPFPISAPGVYVDGVRSTAFGGGKYLVTYTHLINPDLGDQSTNRCIYGRLMDTDGTMGEEFRISTGYGKASEVAFDGTRFLVVWCEDEYDQEVRARFVAPNGTLGTELSVNASAAPSDNPMAVAFNGTNYLVAWADETGGFDSNTWDIRGQRISTTGTLVGGVIEICSEAGAQFPTSIAINGSAALVTYIDITDPADWNVYAQFVDASGTLQGEKIAISEAAGNQMGGIVCSGGTYVAVVNDGLILGEGGFNKVGSAAALGFTSFPPSGTPTTVGTGIAVTGWALGTSNCLVGIENHATRPKRNIGMQVLDTSGNPVGTQYDTGHTGIAPAMAFDGTNYLLTWEDDGLGEMSGDWGFQACGQFFSPAGAPIGMPFTLCDEGINIGGLRYMAFGGGKYLVTYTRCFDESGTPVDRYVAGCLVTAATGDVSEEFRISEGIGGDSDVTFDGTRFLVVWYDGSTRQTVRGRFVHPDGTLGAEIPINSSTQRSDNPVIASFDGTNYLVVWGDETGGDESDIYDIFAQRVSPTGTLIGDVITVCADEGNQIPTYVASGKGGTIVCWLDMNDHADWNVRAQAIGRDGSLVGPSFVVSDDPANQIGGIGFYNNSFAFIVNNGVGIGDDGFTQATGSAIRFLNLPTVSGITPSGGTPAGGTAVSIAGTNLTDATGVKFGDASATSVIVVSPSQITAVAPAGAADSSVFVRIVTPTGTYKTGDVTYTYGGKAAQSINFSAPLAPRFLGSADFSPGATATSGLPVTYSSTNPAVATIVAGKVHIVGTGTTRIVATQAGNTTYTAAASAGQDLTVLAPPAYETWASGIMGDYYPTLGAWDLDPDGDGWTSFLEYALTGTDPTIPEANLVQHDAVIVDDGGTQHIDVVLKANESASGIVVGVAFASDTAGPWTTVTTYAVSPSGERIYSDTTPISTTTPRFYRLIVTPQP